MSTPDSGLMIRYKVGLFTLLSLLLLVVLTVYVGDRPFWWKSCQSHFMSVKDATGLRDKSPVRSLGLQIGYLKTVELHETFVRLEVCITAPVEILPATRAEIRSEGFLGDKFVELRPVRYIGSNQGKDSGSVVPPPAEPASEKSSENTSSFFHWLIPVAHAEEALPPAPSPLPAPALDAPSTPPAAKPAARKGNREIPVTRSEQDMQQTVGQVNELVSELSELTRNLKTALDPKDLQRTMQQLNLTLENAAKTLSPEGGLTTTAQRTLRKLEDAIEQMRDQMTRINQGKGSVGMLLNDPSYAEEMRQAIRNINALLGKVSAIRFVVDLGGEQLTAYHEDKGRGWFQLSIWPSRDRYYTLGISVDPRGKIHQTTTTTTVGSTSTVTDTTQVEKSGLLLSALLGKVFWKRLDLSIGVLYGDGTVGAGLNLGPNEDEERFKLVTNLYSRALGPDYKSQINARISLRAHPIGDGALRSIYFKGGLESLRKVNGKMNWVYGAGISFDDQDIKMLFSFL